MLAARGPTNFDGLYEQPHDNFHGWVGPDMADNAYTAFDPIFWSYHSNIDRCHLFRAVDGLRGLPLTRIHEEYLRTGDNSGSVRLGLSTAILVDAVIVRSALGPALMQMSGKANW
jgi:hypothetical protein